MSNKTPSGGESIPKIPNQELAKRANVYLLSFLFRQYFVNLSQWFTHETAALLLQSHRFSQLQRLAMRLQPFTQKL